MDSSSLTPVQLDKLLHGIARSRDYTFRLFERMKSQAFRIPTRYALAPRARVRRCRIPVPSGGGVGAEGGWRAKTRKSPSREIGGRGGISSLYHPNS